MFVMPSMVSATSQVFNKMKVTHVVFSVYGGRAVCLKSCLALCRLIVENKPEMAS